MIELEIHIPYVDLTYSDLSQYNLLIYKVKENPLGISWVVEKYDDVSVAPQFHLLDANEKCIGSGFSDDQQGVDKDKLNFGGIYLSIWLEWSNLFKGN